MKKESIDVAGASAIYEILNVQKNIDLLHKTNFLLCNRPNNFEYIEELKYIQLTIDKIKTTEIADITPADVSKFLDIVADFQQKMLCILTDNTQGGMLSSRSVCNELFPLIITLQRGLESLYNQSKSNIIKSIENNIRSGQKSQNVDTETCQFMEKFKQLSESEFKIQRLKVLGEMITLVAKIEQSEDSSLLESIRIMNKGL